MAYESWGRSIESRPARVVPLRWRDELPPLDAIDAPMLPYGVGRSYGDSCLNNGGTLLDAAPLSRFIRFDRGRGILECEAGVTLAAILDLVVPHGWFLPVTPGTKLVTIGGAIANDVHGKNHHRAGTFGRHVRSLTLVRSDGARLRCTPDENRELYAATIGGMGLTGLIVSAEVALKRVTSPRIIAENIPFHSIDQFVKLSAESDPTHEYTVAWFDAMSAKEARGIFFRGNHAQSEQRPPRPATHDPRPLPLAPLSPLLVPLAMRAFNALYFRLARRKQKPHVIDYDPFFYPLDAIANWNTMYGRYGFLQYQCVVPRGPVEEIVARVTRSQLGSFLTVIKTFGASPSPGMMSFPREGITLTFDFPAKHRRVYPLLDDLDALVAESGGSVYPAKDARMSAASFQRFFPRWREFAEYIDPRFSSSFWRRVTP
jgi:FAD/FMN-containing dehydrogenase